MLNADTAALLQRELLDLAHAFDADVRGEARPAGGQPDGSDVDQGFVVGQIAPVGDRHAAMHA